MAGIWKTEEKKGENMIFPDAIKEGKGHKSVTQWEEDKN